MDGFGKKGERGALAYYLNKYDEDANVVSARERGNTTAILPAKINRMVMNWTMETSFSGTVRRNRLPNTRQAEETLTDLREQLIHPFTEKVLGDGSSRFRLYGHHRCV